MRHDGLAWHTPTIETGTVVRSMTVPVSLLPHIGGAIGELLVERNWLEVGDTIADIILLVQDMIDSWYTQEMIGAVIPFAGSIPSAWHALNGDSLAEDDYPELASNVPASWLSGGNINLPDMTGASIVGVGTGYNIGATGGTETHTLTVDEIPSHTHDYIPPVINVDVEAPGVPDPVAAGIGPSTATSSSGNGDAHNNMPPYLVLTYAIFTGRDYA
jgi:microcystin-dependent protein